MKVKFRITDPVTFLQVDSKSGLKSNHWYKVDAVENLFKIINRVENEEDLLVACMNDKGESLIGGVWTKIERRKRK